MIKIGILSSHNGSGFSSIQNACEKNILNAQVVVVISNNTTAKVLEKAAKKEIPNYLINSKLFPDQNLDEKITNLMLEHEVDYIFLSGYMKKIEKNLLSSFENKILNSHPALLPNFGGPGMFGRNVHEAVIAAKVKEAGVTIHTINENYDEGEYILQKSIDVLDNDTVDSIEEKIKHLESIAIVEAFQKLLK